MELFARFVASEKEYLHQYSFLLAASGGVDSVVMCDLFHRSGAIFSIAHCNFQLRGEESDRDELFVKALAEKYDKQLFIKKFDTEAYAASCKISIQVAARELRYNWFRELIDRQKADKKEMNCKFLITTAHHADDNIETVVMNFFRGTGLKGLAGIDKLSHGIYRPLLQVRKEDILSYAATHNLQHVEDTSNANSYYTRNYFRNELLPAVSKVFPAVDTNILDTIHRLSDALIIYEHAIVRAKKQLVEVKRGEEHISILKLRKAPAYKTILWEIVKKKNFSVGQLSEVVRLMVADNGSFIDSSSHRVFKNRNWLIITQIDTKETSGHILINEQSKKVHFADGIINIDLIPAMHSNISTEKNVATLDAGSIRYPLVLRRWKQGDYFYPLGMAKKKKLSKFFIDQKLSMPEKEKTWVIEMDKKVVWIVGQRIDDRFKLTASTKQVLKIVFLDNR